MVRQRMGNQLLAVPRGTGARAVVGALCAVQAQDFEPATWSVGSRTRGSRRAGVLRTLESGDVLRTHVLRPTWHFVLAEDIWWLLELTRTRVHATTAARRRQLGLDSRVLDRSVAVLQEALAGGNHLTRKELRGCFEGEGISLEDNRLFHILMYAELEGVVCSGRPQGVQQTYALLDERVERPGRSLSGEEASRELLIRYLRGRGPATLDDFRWWSSTTAATARRALDLARGDLVHERVEGMDLWSLRGGRREGEVTQRAAMLHAYDELVVGYRESRRLIASPGLDIWDRSFLGVLLVDGRHAGNWRRRLDGERRVVEVVLHRRIPRDARSAIEEETQRMAWFFDEELPLRFVRT